MGSRFTSLFDVVATGDQAAESKPHPGILNAAMKRLNVVVTAPMPMLYGTIRPPPTQFVIDP